MTTSTMPQRVMALAEEKEREESASLPTVYKYRSARETGEALLRLFSGIEEGTVSAALVKTRLIGVVSPVGRALKTGFALTLGQLLSPLHALNVHFREKEERL